MNLWVLLLVIILILAILGAPGVGVFKHDYGYWPSGVGTIIVVILLIALLTGRL